ncbi:MAG TPA: hypothetical protein VF941_19220 [Clostridia bacterium]
MEKVKKITHSKIGRNRAIGLAYCESGEIVIDERLRGLEHLTILLHEVVHVLNPKWSEIKVEGHSKEMAKILWDQKYRKVDL